MKLVSLGPSIPHHEPLFSKAEPFTASQNLKVTADYEVCVYVGGGTYNSNTTCPHSRVHSVAHFICPLTPGL